MGKKFHKEFVKGSDLTDFDENIKEAMKKLPPNATIESVNYNTLAGRNSVSSRASALIIYSTPIGVKVTN